MNPRRVGGLMLVMLAGCAHAASNTAAGAIDVPAADVAIVPLADHHQHLFSPQAAAWGSETPLPAVELPAELARLLADREAAWNDRAQLARLYADSGAVLNREGANWVRGGGEAAAFMSTLFARQYRVTPVAYQVDGASGWIAGYFARDVETGVRRFGNVLLALHRGVDGRWKIAAELPSFPGPLAIEPFAAERLVAALDEAGTRRAAVLSVAYWFGGSPSAETAPDEYARVRAENDWVAREVARYPDRLVGFCSFNPLRDYALQEIDRCAANPHLKGIKLHFGNSWVDLADPAHVEQLRRVFRAANRHGMPVIAHLWTDPGYEAEGGRYAGIFLGQLLPEAPDVVVQIAHMAGGGRATDAAMAVYAAAIAAGDARTRHLYFDVATLVDGETEEGLRQDVARMRQIGMERFLWGTDGPTNPSARQAWAAFRMRLPLTDDEFRTIATNVAPYLR
jgi:predicted TIM-barrel fold metal-dependent hydrolase